MNRIVVKRELAPKIKLIEVENAGIAAKSRPGQFVVLHLGEKGEKFPLTIAGANPSEGTIKLVFNEVGKSTQQLGTFNVGEEIPSVAGPLGNPTAMKNFGTVVCFGGGVMIGPLVYEVAAFRKVGNKVITVIGTRTKELLIFKEELRALSDEFYVCTDDGSEGHQGLDFLREVFERGKIDRVLVMSVSTATLKAVSEITRSYGVKTIVSLTPLMLDGTGMCGCCRVSIGGQTKFACIDGPEFDGHEVDWELLESRKRMYSSEERISSLSYEVFGEEFALPKETA
jgi:ferredoxin--NADP+ reductase